MAESRDSTKALTRVMKCACAHDFQDKQYGKGQRLHNPCKSGNDIGYRCTVCSNQK